MIRINPLFFIVLILAWISGLLFPFILVLGIAVLHEIGHAVCAKILGYKIIKISVQPWGVCLKTENFRIPRHEWLIAAAGPAVNVLLLFIGFIVPADVFLIANMFMLIINLLPVYPLDGGRIVLAVLQQETDRRSAQHIIRIVSGITTVVLFVAGGILLYKTKMNFSVLLAALFIGFTSDGGAAYETAKADETLRKTKHYCVRANDAVKIILKIRRKQDFVVLDVVDERFRYMGSLSLREVMECIAQEGYEIKFEEILRKHLIY